ncbi:NRDE family protein [Hydrogenophaga sp. PBL-H3]|uniref:NRDE family protein n=1 Tax=Hydrogenophaga sp. PBL-H3 TaxID=434010 RepID=UPI00131FB3D3|nr:NRDE family protein [Hydrogenophaga sp. PBL-H3]QHE76537.1 NRDE family protein [Hydrogenophaga sp. PBL-H3]QHE80961.1 NRDE family protein [Hydrogenophaga sp. PBL-H3]
MCLIAFALNTDPAWPLLIAANRDEFLDRPTAPLHRWLLDDGTEVVGGRDLRDGGTWLGLSPQGRVAMLTNVRQPMQEPALRSRGELVTRWLQSAGDAERFAAGIAPAEYGAFNLVVGDFHARAWHWLGNRDPDAPHGAQANVLHRRALGMGIYGLSNASLDTPWPKTRRLKAALGESLGTACDWLSPLSRALTHEQPEQDLELPHTGVPEDLERALSSPFVRMAGRAYGTRTSHVVSVRALVQGFAVTVDEWTHDPALPVAGLVPEQARRETLVW